MKIVKIGYHCCIRLVKQAVALGSDSNYQIHLIGFGKPNVDQEYFRTFVLCKIIGQLEDAVTLHDQTADIYHVHNEPNWMVMAVRRISDKPIILDVHDSMAYRSDKDEHKSTAERLALDLANGFVFPSEKCAEITREQNPNIKDKPFCILPPYVNKKYYKLQDWSWVGGLIYQGLTSTNDSPEFMQYANFQELAQALKLGGIPFHIQTTRNDKPFLEFYQDAILEPSLPYHNMIKGFGHFDWGFCGNIKPYKDWNVAMPNKLFEYMAGGIPIIAMNCQLVEEFVQKHGVGIAVKTIAELKERWLSERAQCQANVIKKRFDFTMEEHIHAIKELYSRVL